MLIVEVVLPTPPFWFTMAMTRAGPWDGSAAGTGNSESGLPVGPTGRGSLSIPAPRTLLACSSLTMGQPHFPLFLTKTLSFWLN